MSNNVPDYINKFIEFNKKTLRDIYEAGCAAEDNGLLMIEVKIDENDSKVYFVGEKRWEDMGKGEFYNEIKEKLPKDGKDNMILYIMDRTEDKVHLIVVNKE